MLGGKLYKTKLCILYQRGRCARPNCNFAHGDAELRRFSGGSSFNDEKGMFPCFCQRREEALFSYLNISNSTLTGRRRSADLRDKLEKRHSPHRRYSPGRDARGYDDFHGQKTSLHDSGNVRSRSPIKRRHGFSERRHRKNQHMDRETDDSESLRLSDGNKGPKIEDKVSSYNEKDSFNEQLNKVHSDIERLEDDKCQIKIDLEVKVGEAEKLSKRIEDLEIQLNREQEDCRRITSKIKKFVRAHGRHSKAQEELKRSQTRLERIGHHLGSDILKLGTNEEDSSVNILSDGELNGGGHRSPRIDELKSNSSPLKKRTHVSSSTNEEVKIGNSQKRGRFTSIFSNSEKLIRSEGPAIQSETDNHETEQMEAAQNKKDVFKSLVDKYKIKRGKNNYISINPSDKVKASESTRPVMPSTGIAAYAGDELIEAIEMEERPDAMEGSAVNKNGAAAILPLPPPPVKFAYKQLEGDDEDVDVERVDNEMLDIDLNCEVEIE